MPAAARAVLWAGYAQIENACAQLAPLDRWIGAYARAHPGCRELIARHWGVGAVTGVTILAELGDARLKGAWKGRSQRAIEDAELLWRLKKKRPNL